ncbi:MAG TPA: hypothetical protein VD764_04595 [Nocardioides sp.]|jgi:hypothetical protein|nr:hypothetical protein [Nocardioides sp.]
MNRPELSDTAVRRCGLAAVVLALASIPLAPLNALARMQTESGRSDLENPQAAWWAQPAMDALQPWLLDFADVDRVYVTYGKFYLIAVVAVLACVLAAWSRRPSELRWAERWGWRLTVVGYAVMGVGHVVAYWLLWVEAGFAVIIGSMLVGIFGNVLLGYGLLRAGFRPRLAAWVVLLDLPFSLVLVEMSTMALSMWPMMLAWGLVGWSMWRAPSPRATTAPSPVVAARP